MRHSESIKELAASMAKAAVSFPSIQRGCTANVVTKSGAKYSYDYADLDDILSAVRTPLAQEGITISHDCVVSRDEHGGLSVTTIAILRHASGEWIESSPLVIPCDGTMSAAQLIGSGCTYGKRYTSQDILGLSTEADDDANTASGNDASTGKRESAAKPACPQCGKTESVIKGKPEFGGGWVCWIKKGGCNATWSDAPPAGDNGDQHQKEAQLLPMTAANWKVITSLLTQDGQKALLKHFKVARPRDMLASQFDDAMLVCHANKAWLKQTEPPPAESKITPAQMTEFDTLGTVLQWDEGKAVGAIFNVLGVEKKPLDLTQAEADKVLSAMRGQVEEEVGA